MSLSETSSRTMATNRRRAFAVACVVAASFTLAGCGGSGFQPLYSSVTATGVPVSEAMATIDIAAIPGRVGQRLRNELIFRTTGGGYAVEPRYRLDIAIRESLQSILVEVDGNARGLVYRLDANLQIVDLSTNQVVLKDIASTRASYEQFNSTFANIRARRDAENRAADDMAQSIRTRIAAFLARPV
ncbi:MAG: hypothetical protein GC150_13785 [Rhizobiales bacterium]|nr:hypothetical protein [Hyphomicrobiales bacterium]